MVASKRRRGAQINYNERSSESESDNSSSSFSEDDNESDNEVVVKSHPSPKRSRRTRSMLPLKAEPKKPIKKPTFAPRQVHRINAPNTITPLKRRGIERSIAKSPYELARERLHVSAVPDSLPCRDNEFAEILGYLDSAISDGSGTCIYISGVPGTGKTATVLEVIRYLQHQVEQGEIAPFDFAEINGMKLTDPNQAYSVLWECLNKDQPKLKRVTPAHALELIENKFNQGDREKTTVVLMDELDLLVTRKQTVMYNFFEWPNRPFSKLIVIAIANTMDLPERMLSNKISSRMGLTRINFQPYTHQQLCEIVQSRLQGIEAFEKDAVEFAARKVSAVSGDARRALDICRRAVELVEAKQASAGNANTNTSAQVTIAIVNAAIKEMLSSSSVAFIQSCSLHQKLFLIAVMQLVRRTGLGDVEFGDVALFHTQTCKWHHIDPPTTSDLMRVCESLGQVRALVVESGRMDLGMRISLNVSEEDIVMACKGDRVADRLVSSL